MDEIGKILPSLFKKQICRDEPHLLEILLPLWPRIAGKSIAHHSRPAHFAAGVLTLAADSTPWTTQLRHMSEAIRAQINSFLGQPVVKKVRIKTVIPATLSFPLRPARKSAAPAGLPVEGVMDTAAIADPTLASALASSYTKYFNRPRR